jgi:hypothetical protein
LLQQQKLQKQTQLRTCLEYGLFVQLGLLLAKFPSAAEDGLTREQFVEWWLSEDRNNQELAALHHVSNEGHTSGDGGKGAVERCCIEGILDQPPREPGDERTTDGETISFIDAMFMGGLLILPWLIT